MNVFLQAAIILLLALLPWHAFFVTWFSDFFFISSSVLSLWKEFLILVLSGFFVKKWVQEKSFPIKFYFFDYIFFVFLGIALLSAVFLTQDLTQSLLGFKYDFSFFVLFYLIRGLIDTEEYKEKFLFIFLHSAFLSVLFGLVLYFFFPADILLYFGYSENISSYYPGQALPMYHMLADTGISRLASTFSSPNHFAFFLIILTSVLFAFYKKIRSYVAFPLSGTGIFSTVVPRDPCLRRDDKSGFITVVLFYAFIFLSFLALILTFSRSAFLAFGFIFLLYFLLPLLQGEGWGEGLKNYKKIMLSILGVGGAIMLLGFLVFPQFSQQMIVRTTSSSEHLNHSYKALQYVYQNPLGIGLGTAGPASLRSDVLQTVYVPTQKVIELEAIGLEKEVRNEVFLYDTEPDENGLVAFKPKSFIELQNISIFQELQNSENIINLWNEFYQERIAENWHLQMFQEFGIMGGLVWLFFLFFFLKHLLKKAKENNFAKAGFLALSAFIIMGLFLHVFESAPVSYILFILLAFAV